MSKATRESMMQSSNKSNKVKTKSNRLEDKYINQWNLFAKICIFFPVKSQQHSIW